MVNVRGCSDAAVEFVQDGFADESNFTLHWVYESAWHMVIVREVFLVVFQRDECLLFSHNDHSFRDSDIFHDPLSFRVYTYHCRCVGTLVGLGDVLPE